MCPFTLWNGADTLHQTHPPSVTVLEMTDEGRAEDMDPSSILGGLGCSEKGRVFGTSFAIRWLLGAYSASSVLGHHRGQVNVYQRGATHNIRYLRLFICADLTGPVSRGFLWWDSNTTWYREFSGPSIQESQTYQHEW